MSTTNYDTFPREKRESPREVSIISDSGEPEVKNTAGRAIILALVMIPVFWLPLGLAVLAFVRGS